MNTSGCPLGLFTDEILLVRRATDAPCDSHVAAWLGIVAVFVVLRALLLVPIVAARVRKGDDKKRPRKLPMFILSQVATTFFMMLFFVLASTTVISTRDGSSLLVLSIFFGCVSFGHLQMMHSIIKLGKMIIPLGKRNVSSENQKSFDNLGKTDMVLSVIISLARVGIILFVVFFLCFFAVGHGKVLWFYQAGFICVFFYQAFITLAVVYQFSRCIKAIYQCQLVSQNSSTRQDNRPLMAAVRTMRIQQTIVLVVGLPLATLSILIAVEVIRFHWYLFAVLYVVIEVLLLAVLVLAPKLASALKGKHGRGSQTAPTSNKSSKQLHVGTTMLSTSPPDQSHGYPASGVVVSSSYQQE